MYDYIVIPLKKDYNSRQNVKCLRLLRNNGYMCTKTVMTANSEI